MLNHEVFIRINFVKLPKRKVFIIIIIKFEVGVNLLCFRGAPLGEGRSATRPNLLERKDSVTRDHFVAGCYEMLEVRAVQFHEIWRCNFHENFEMTTRHETLS